MCAVVDTTPATKMFSKDFFPILHFKTPIVWINTVLIIVSHLGLIPCFLVFPYVSKWKTVVWCIIVGSISGFGVTAGAHRLWSHRSFKAKTPLRIFLMLCYCISGQNDLYNWVRDHRVHHKFSESDADPHNAKRGFFFSHVGWLMMKKHSEVIEKGRKIDMDDLLQDPVVVFHLKYFVYLKTTFCFLLPPIVPALCWEETWFWSICSQIARYVVCLNFTWLVNSIAHMWGNKPYDRKISPSENGVVSFLSLGEGWHNYHHTFPWDYRAGELGRFSITTMYLDLFSKLGWIYDLKSTSQSLVRKVVQSEGDRTWTPCNISETTDIDENV